MNSFDKYIDRHNEEPLTPIDIETVQANITLKCNMECEHCHVSSSPRRTEMMDSDTMDHVHRVTNQLQPERVDLTGGAPEIHPEFRPFVERFRKNDHPVMVRTNLTILLEDGYTDLPEFFHRHNIKLVASLPCYSKENVDQQRGEGTYNKSIEAIKRLNELGYGTSEDYQLDLVYNPVGSNLPPSQEQLEQDYKEELFERFGLHFNNLLTITNMPIGMFLHQLRQQGKAAEYRDLLRENFNPATLNGLMCRNQINIGWDGTLYDCDFNLALRMPVEKEAPQNIKEFDYEAFINRKIVTGEHCFGCTAGAGSSCGGSLVEDESTADDQQEKMKQPSSRAG